jgi:uncharacterized protein (DUF1697 family)
MPPGAHSVDSGCRDDEDRHARVNTWIALFRGINVGGANMLPMKQLKLLLEKNDCSDVQTYIQSGNVIFRSALSDARRVERRLADAVAGSHGFEPRVLALTRQELERAAAGNPFARANEEDPRSVHLFFLEASPKKPDTKGLDALRTATERFVLKGRVFYLHTPDGFGKSKLAQRTERLLGVAATARNWRTVTTLVEMTKAYL